MAEGGREGLREAGGAERGSGWLRGAERGLERLERLREAQSG